MTIYTDDTLTPRAWIGCLACYNAGRLVGEWFDAETADEVTLADVHGGTERVREGCEELWVMDHEGIPVRGEMSPLDAAEWGQALMSVPEHLRPALCAWVDSGDYTVQGTGDLPSVGDFEERYAGCWDSFRDYAQNLADETGMLRDAPESLISYFDWDAWTRDLEADYTTTDAAGGGVYVFRSF